MPNKNSYQNNMYRKLCRNPKMVEKYGRAGIYSININGVIVYIGKSRNMLQRMAQHYVGVKTGKEHKYRLMAEAQRRGYPVGFDVLYKARSVRKEDIEEEIGRVEGQYIRRYRPILNTQIPKEEDWRQYEYDGFAAGLTEEQFMQVLSNE